MGFVRRTVLLLAFLGFLVCVWMLPLLVAGYPPFVPVLGGAKEFFASGTFLYDSGFLYTRYLALWGSVIGWEDLYSWIILNAATFAVALFVLWHLVRCIASEKEAWITVVLTGLLPIYWFEAVTTFGYTLAFVFLFLAGLSYWFLRSRPYSAVALSGLLLGLSIASKDAFVTFVPWVGLCLLWQYRSVPLKAVLLSALLVCTVLTGWTAPSGDPVGVLSRLAGGGDPHINHLYPDDYTAVFDREEYDAELREQLHDASFLEARHNENYRILFGVADGGVLQAIGNGIWLLLNQLPLLFMQETVGGFLLWLLIIPGGVSIWRRNRFLFVFLLGLYVTNEVTLRFVLHFSRNHLMDTAWILSFLAAVGICTLSQQLSKQVRLSSALIALLLTLGVSGHLLQVNRHSMTKLYAKSLTPAIFAATDVLRSLPADAVVVHPRRRPLFSFVDTVNVELHTKTVDRFAARGRLHEPLTHYGVTHALGYSEEQGNLLREARPSIIILPPLEKKRFSVEYTPFVRYLLNTIR